MILQDLKSKLKMKENDILKITKNFLRLNYTILGLGLVFFLFGCISFIPLMILCFTCINHIWVLEHHLSIDTLVPSILIKGIVFIHLFSAIIICLVLGGNYFFWSLVSSK